MLNLALVRNLSESLVRSLDGSPLAIEQAGADLCSQGPLSASRLRRYVLQLEAEYNRMMTTELETEDCYYEKDNKSIIGTFNLLEEAMNKQNPDAARLLMLCSVMGNGNIPTSIFFRIVSSTEGDEDMALHLPSLRSSLKAPDKFDWLAELDEQRFMKALMALQKFCCIKVRIVSNEARSFYLQHAISRWCRGKLVGAGIEEWALLAAYKISQCLSSQNVAIVERNYMSHVRATDSFLLSQAILSKRVQGSGDILCWYEWAIMMRFAKFYYQQRAFSEAFSSIQRARNLELLLCGDSVLKDLSSIKRRHLMGLIYRDYGETLEACEIFVGLLSACKEVLGVDDDLTMIVARQSTSLWNQRFHDDQLRQRASAARDTKTTVWSPEPAAQEDVVASAANTSEGPDLEPDPVALPPSYFASPRPESSEAQQGSTGISDSSGQEGNSAGEARHVPPLYGLRTIPSFNS
jgi:hypothetical protein